jgi:hypothetical protein
MYTEHQTIARSISDKKKWKEKEKRERDGTSYSTLAEC